MRTWSSRDLSSGEINTPYYTCSLGAWKQISSASSLFFSANSTTDAAKTVVIVDGIRLPFAMSSTIYEDLMAVDLQRLAIKGLVDKVALPKEEVDYVIAGSVIQEVRTSNIAREAAVNAGLPISIGGHTVSMVRERESDVLFCFYFIFSKKNAR